MDAVYRAINRIVGEPNQLIEFSIKAVTEGIDSIGEVTIRIQTDQPIPGTPASVFSGHGAATDIIVASGRAYMSALNKLLAARRETSPLLQLNGNGNGNGNGSDGSGRPRRRRRRDPCLATEQAPSTLSLPAAARRHQPAVKARGCHAGLLPGTIRLAPERPGQPGTPLVDESRMTQARTLLDKIWDDHVVAAEPGCPAVLYIDLHLVHEVTSPAGLSGAARARPARAPAGPDLRHDGPQHPHSRPLPAHRRRHVRPADRPAGGQLPRVRRDPLRPRAMPRRGVVHIIGPELGLTQPGMTIVCGDSHTATHGAFGALAFGIGTSEVEHVLATQCLLQHKPRPCEWRSRGRAAPAPLPPGVTAKDVILALIARIGIGGGTGHVIEYTGTAIRALSMEERMTICNMTIEAGARAGMVAPDDTTFEYLAGRPFAPKGEDWDRSRGQAWRALPSDEGAVYDRTFTLDVGTLPPMITFGTNPGMAMTVTGRIPDPALRRR